MLEINNAVKCYGKTEVLHSISYKIEDNSSLGIIGSNGAGKTTLCMAANGLTKLTSGDIIINSFSVTKNPKEVKRITGLYTDKLLLYENITVKESLKYYMGLYKVSKVSYNEMIGLFEINKFENKKIRELSTGMKKKVCLSISIMNNPEVLFLDEPFSGLDPLAKEEFIDIVKELYKRSNIQVLISSHDLYELENIIDNVIIMDKGKIVESGNIRLLNSKYFKEQDIHIIYRTKSMQFLKKYNSKKINNDMYEAFFSINMLSSFFNDYEQDIQVFSIKNNICSLEKLYGKVTKK